MKKLVDVIGLPALLEQTAEECIELAHACLKLSRDLRGENPTFKDRDAILDNLNEELADVHICTTTLIHDSPLHNRKAVFNYLCDKTERMKERFNLDQNDNH